MTEEGNIANNIEILSGVHGDTPTVREPQGDEITGIPQFTMIDEDNVTDDADVDREISEILNKIEGNCTLQTDNSETGSNYSCSNPLCVTRYWAKHGNCHMCQSRYEDVEENVQHILSDNMEI